MKSEESMLLATLETALKTTATRMAQTTSGRTTQMQRTVVTTMQQVLDFFSCWMITGAGAAGGGAELKD